jgi:hypothetical protein
MKRENMPKKRKKRYLRPREFAVRLGVYVTTVYKAIQHGRIESFDNDYGEQMIDWETEAKKFIETSNTPKRFYKKLNWNDELVKHEQGEQAETRDSSGEQVYSLTNARALKETYLAKKAKINYQLERGELIRPDEIEHDLRALALTHKKSLLSIPSRTSAMLAAESDPRKCTKILNDELKNVLHEFADEIERVAAQKNINFADTTNASETERKDTETREKVRTEPDTDTY